MLDSGILHLDIVEANDLGHPFHSYAEVSLNGREQFKTKTLKKSANPRYEEGLDYIVHSRLSSNLYFQLFDKKLGADVLIGSASLPLDLIRASPEVSAVKIPLDSGSGSITIRYLFEGKALRELPPPENFEAKRQSHTAVGKLGKGMMGQLNKIADVGVALGSTIGVTAKSGPVRRETMRGGSANLSTLTLVEEDLGMEGDVVSPPVGRSLSIRSTKSHKSQFGSKRGTSFMLSMFRKDPAQ